MRVKKLRQRYCRLVHTHQAGPGRFVSKHPLQIHPVLATFEAVTISTGMLSKGSVLN